MYLINRKLSTAMSAAVPAWLISSGLSAMKCTERVLSGGVEMCNRLERKMLGQVDVSGAIVRQSFCPAASVIMADTAVECAVGMKLSIKQADAALNPVRRVCIHLRKNSGRGSLALDFCSAWTRMPCAFSFLALVWLG